MTRSPALTESFCVSTLVCQPVGVSPFGEIRSSVSSEFAAAASSSGLNETARSFATGAKKLVANCRSPSRASKRFRRSMRRYGARFSSLIMLAALASCGGIHYGFAGGGLPSNIRTMAVLPFDNQTTSPDVQRELLDAMRRELQKRLGVRDASESKADAVVRGVITGYDVDVPVGVSANPSTAV